MTLYAIKPLGRCPGCRYKRSSLNHRVLCLESSRAPSTPRREAETERLAALATYGDTPAEQHDRRDVLAQAQREGTT